MSSLFYSLIGWTAAFANWITEPSGRGPAGDESGTLWQAEAGPRRQEVIADLCWLLAARGDSAWLLGAFVGGALAIWLT